MPSKPRVPWKPEPLAALRRRYPIAVADVVVQLDVVNGRRDAPSGDPAHVFDTTGGLRLIVSLEQLPDGRVGTHISSSCGNFPAYVNAFPTPTAAGVHAAVVSSWQAIAQSTRIPQLLGVSPRGIPHFFVERAN